MADDVSALLAQVDWLRVLARKLGASEDAAQDTLVAALRSPPDPARPARPWLARVLRNAVRMQRRGDGRRGRREDASAAGEPTLAAAPDDAVARAETFRALVELVLALPEPARATLVRHYFDGDSFADIARRDRVPESTVRWRHKQAIDQLRAQLDARAGGDRRAWLAALAPLAAPPAHATPTLVLGGLVVNKLVLGAAIAAAAGLVAWRLVPRAPALTSSSTAAIRGSAAAALAPASPSASPDPALAPPPRHVRRLANAEERRVLADQIATAHARHAAALRAAMHGAGTTADGQVLAGAAPPSAGSDAPMDRDTIRSAMHEVIPFITDCYTDAQPSLGSNYLEIRAHLTFTGDRDVGTIVDADRLFDASHTALPTKLDDCLRSTFQTLELPPLGDGEKMDVDYPFVFSVGSDDGGSGSG